jgi:hypothetical protein
MKTTIEIPDSLFRQAKSSAAQRGISLKDLFAEALSEQLRRKTGQSTTSPPWMKAFGGLRGLHQENKRLDRIIKSEFDQVDEEDWR